MESLIQQLSLLEHWQIALLGTGLLLQGLTGAAFPEEIIITSLGVLWGQGKIAFAEAWLAVALGLLPANQLPAFLGRRWGMKALSSSFLKRFFNPDSVQQALHQIRLHGVRVIFLSRFIPLVRGPIYFATGVAQITWLQFLKADAAALCIHTPLLLLIGGKIGKEAASLMEAYQRLAGMILASFLAVILIRFLISRKSKNRNSGSTDLT